MKKNRFKKPPKDKIKAEAFAIGISPKDKKIFGLLEKESNGTDNILKQSPYVVLKYFQENWQCFSEWKKDDLKKFSKFLARLGKQTWEDVYKTAGSVPKQGLGYTKYALDDVKGGAKEHLKRVKKSISEDIDFFELRVDQGKLRVHGFQSQAGFFLVLLDREHAIFPS